MQLTASVRDGALPPHEAPDFLVDDTVLGNLDTEGRQIAETGSLRDCRLRKINGGSDET